MSARFMRTQLIITGDNIDERALLQERVMTPSMGAAVYFTGAVRGTEEGRAISALEYEAFQQMAEHQFHLLFEQAGKRWPLESIRLVHRIGRVCDEHMKIFHIETALNSKMFDGPLSFLMKNEDDFTEMDRLTIFTGRRISALSSREVVTH